MDRFFCISQEEIDALLKTRGNDWRVYLELRQKADFITGWLTHHSAKKMTAASIGRKVSLPSTAGVPALEMTRKDVSRALERLIKCGLIDHLSRENRFLRLRLPHVARRVEEQTKSQNRLPPVESEIPSGLPQTGPATKPAIQGLSASSKERLPHNEPQDTPRASRTNAVKSAEIIALHGFAGNDAGGVNNKNKTISNTPLVNEGGNHSPSAGKTHSPALRAYDEKPEKTETGKPDTADRVRSIVAEVGKDRYGNNLIRNLYSERSKVIFRGLAEFDERDIREAVRKVISDNTLMKSPESIDAVLRPTQYAKKRPEPLTRKGSLAL